MNISGIIGFGAFFGALGVAAIMGGNAAVFASPASAILVAGLTLGAGLMAFDLKDFLESLRALRVLVVRVPDEAIRLRHARVLRGLIPLAYAAWGLATMMGLVRMLGAQDDLAMIGVGTIISFVPGLSSVILAEGLLRPGAQRIDNLCALRAPEAPPAPDTSTTAQRNEGKQV